MKNTKAVSLEYSLFTISDLNARGGAPEFSGVRRIAGNSQCVVVGTLMNQDGDTEITLADSVSDVSETGAPAFDGVIETPSCQVVLLSMGLDVVLEMKTTRERTRVRVWTNHPREPNKITIVIGVGRTTRTGKRKTKSTPRGS